MINSKVGGKYLIQKKIGSGSFGEVYVGINQNGEVLAIKAEKLSVRHPQLIYESRVLKLLQGSTGIPSVI